MGESRVILYLIAVTVANAARILHSGSSNASKTRKAFAVSRSHPTATHRHRDSTASSKDICHSIHRLQCQDEDITALPAKRSEECCQACQNQAGCNAWTWDWKSPEKLCHLKGACNFQRTTSSRYHSGIALDSRPTPTPTPTRHQSSALTSTLTSTTTHTRTPSPTYTPMSISTTTSTPTRHHTPTPTSTPTATPTHTPTPTPSNAPHYQEGPDTLIDEYNDPGMGIAFSMLSKKGWESGYWGLMAAPTEYTKWAQSYVSIMTREQDMGVYRSRSHGLAFHITPNSDFWQFFQVIQKGSNAGSIVGGPGDGGSHTPDSASHRLGLHAAGKGYEWFKSQKDKILADYNTVYGNHDYNEFITNGLSKASIAGILRKVGSDSETPTDEELCQFLIWHRHAGLWPVYAYDRTSSTPLKIDRYLDCPTPTPAPTMNPTSTSKSITTSTSTPTVTQTPTSSSNIQVPP